MISATSALASVPLEPSAPDAQELLLDELADPAYAAAQPTWFDLLSQAVLDWIMNLSFAGGEGPAALGLLIIAILLAIAIVTTIVIYGVPRLRQRSRAAGDLFGDVDGRTAAQLRAAAESSATAGDWASAVADLFRALARHLDERTIVSVLPGTTGHSFAESAGRLFPHHRDDLGRAADFFDGVRYLGRAGTAEQYAHVRDLDVALQSAPSPLPPVAEIGMPA